MCAHVARQEKLDNFSLLISHVLVPPALLTLLADPEARVDAFLAAGHVCTVMGLEAYRPIAERHRVPIVATGFEPLDLLQGILMCIRQLESGRHEVENQYARAVSERGNLEAQHMLGAVFEVVPRKWRGIGEIPASGLGLRGDYQTLDAEQRFDVGDAVAEEPAECRSGRILKGLEKPTDCPAFGTRCTPDHPLGATMVSSEGACAAYFQYRRSS
jgi:hydrogenase expression/formation protein HypD